MCALATLAAGRADAHATGVSQSAFTLDSGATVRATLVLAQADAAILARGADDASAMRDLVAAGIDVRADGDRCPGTYESASIVGGDGFELHASFACPHAPRTLAVALPLLDELPAGHAHLIRIAAPGASSEAALRSGAQEAKLVVRGEASTWFARVALGGALVLAVALIVWRLRARASAS